MNFNERVVVLTGAGTGIGKSLTHALLRDGARVVLAGRRLEKLKETIDESGRPESASAISVDLSKLADQKRLVAFARERFGRIDVLVNNAGIVYAGPVDQVRPEEVNYIFRVNAVAPIWLCQLVVPEMQQRGDGLIVNVASVAARVAVPCQSFYCATKFALDGFSDALRRELLGTGVHVLTVYPGNVESEMVSGEVKAKLLETRFKHAGMMPADDAAREILHAMKKRRKSVVVAGRPERALMRLNRWVPGLLDRRLRTLKPSISKILETITDGVRRRNAPLPVE